MSMRLATLLCCLGIAACATQPRVDTAVLPFAAFGTMDNDTAAANQAAWAFASPQRTRNDPVDAARAVAAIDFLAGELSSNPGWVTVSPLTKQQMLQARQDVRRALGIAPTTPSQVVVNALLGFAAAWQGGNRPGALQLIAVPGFTLSPEQTLQTLSNMPYIQSANLASTDAAQQMMPGGDLHRVE